MSKPGMIPIAELIEDMTIYPRHVVDSAHVASLANALRAGTTLPPIVVDRASKRIVDGWHRVRAKRQVSGPTVMISAEMRSYATEADLVVDAVSMNASHGRRLDTMDQARAILMLERLAVTPRKIAGVLHVPEQRVITLKGRIAYATAPSAASVPGTDKIVLKRSLSHMRDKTLTDAQIKAQALMPGTSLLLTTRQLTAAIHAKLIDQSNETLIEALRELYSALAEMLPASRGDAA